MKIEVVDKYNPIFVRVATICDVEHRQVRVRFDGWPEGTYDFWTEDASPDLHPIQWCAKSGHDLMAPLSKYFDNVYIHYTSFLKVTKPFLPSF